MKNKEVETTVYIDQDRIMKEINLLGWKTASNADVEKFRRAVLSKINDTTDVVSMVGQLPTEVGMVIAAALAQRVVRFEYGEFRKLRSVIFDYSEQCPEMKV